MDIVLANLTSILALLATGVFAGLLAGLLGVGGGIVIVPVLYFLLQSFAVSAHSAIMIATATSLAIIVPTSISSIKAHLRRGNVDVSLVKAWCLYILLGVLLGSLLVTQVGGQWLSGLFGVVACYAALNMLFRTKQSVLASSLPKLTVQRFIASGIGIISAMVGIGGGTLSVPTLTTYGYSAQRAVGSAAAIGLVISLPAAVFMLTLGETPVDAPFGTLGLVNIVALACIVPLTVLCAPLGARLASVLASDLLKKMFAAVLFITGLRMFAQFLFS